MLVILISTQIPAEVQFLIIFLLLQVQHHHPNPSLQCTKPPMYFLVSVVLKEELARSAKAALGKEQKPAEPAAETS